MVDNYCLPCYISNPAFGDRLAMDLFLRCVTIRQSLETIYQAPRGPLPHQFHNRPPQKLGSRYTQRRLLKRRRRGAMVALTQRRVPEQASTLVRTISSCCQIRIEGNQAWTFTFLSRVHCMKIFPREYLSCTCNCLIRKIYYPRKYLQLCRCSSYNTISENFIMFSPVKLMYMTRIGKRMANLWL